MASSWRFGGLHRGGSALSRRVLGLLCAAVGDNPPYAMDQVDITIPLHADARGLDSLALEVRQALIADAAGQAVVGQRQAEVLAEAIRGA